MGAVEKQPHIISLINNEDQKFLGTVCTSPFHTHTHLALCKSLLFLLIGHNGHIAAL